MGEYAEMMFDGTLCAGCGVYLSGEALGFSRLCSHCERDLKSERKKENIAAHDAHIASQKKCKCPTCGRKVKEVGLNDHMRDAHGGRSD